MRSALAGVNAAVVGLLLAVFVSYRKKRVYNLEKIEQVEQVAVSYNPLTLVIADTGCGFDPAMRGHGLVNMTDRLSSIGGTLDVDSAAGRGTRIVAVVTAPI